MIKKAILSLCHKHPGRTGLDPLCLLNSLNYLWCIFNRMLESLLRDFGPYLKSRIPGCCRLLKAERPWCKSPIPPYPKGSLLHWELIVIFIILLVFSMSTLTSKGWTWSITIFIEAVVFKWCLDSTMASRTCQENISPTVKRPKTSLHYLYKAEQSYGFLFFYVQFWRHNLHFWGGN